MLMPEQMRAGRGGVLAHQMAARLEQAAALDRKQGGAADRQLAAELLGGQPGIWGGHGQQELPREWQRERLPRELGREVNTRTTHGWMTGYRVLPTTCSARYRWFSDP